MPDLPASTILQIPAAKPSYLNASLCLFIFHIRASDSPDHPEQHLPPWILLPEDALGNCIELELWSFNFPPHPEFPLGGSIICI